MNQKKFSQISVFLAAIGAMVSSCLAQSNSPENFPPLNGRGIEGYKRYLSSAEPVKAFAISPNGDWHFVSKRANRPQAVVAALYTCNKESQHICRIFAVNNDTVYQRYAAFEQESRALLEKLKGESLAFSNYGDENRDYRVAPFDGLKRGPYNEGTPMQVKGVNVVKLVELLKLMTASNAPLVIDVMEGDGHKTLPGAYWIKGAGFVTEGEDSTAEISDRLGFVLTGLTGKDKSFPLVFLCGDSSCWLSHNAAVRARNLGYTNVQWFRGGLQTWGVARLPTLDAAQYGQVR